MRVSERTGRRWWPILLLVGLALLAVPPIVLSSCSAQTRLPVLLTVVAGGLGCMLIGAAALVAIRRLGVAILVAAVTIVVVGWIEFVITVSTALDSCRFTF